MIQEINPYDFRVVEHEGKEYLCFKVLYNNSFSEIKAIELSNITYQEIGDKYYDKLYANND